VTCHRRPGDVYTWFGTTDTLGGIAGDMNTGDRPGDVYTWFGTTNTLGGIAGDMNTGVEAG